MIVCRGVDDAGLPNNAQGECVTFVCPWCNKPLGEKPSHNPMVSHGICRRCAEELLKEERRNLEELLRTQRVTPPSMPETPSPI